MSNPYKTVRVRHNVMFEQSLYEEIQSAAEKNLRTFSAEVSVLCAESLRRRVSREVLPTPLKGTGKHR